MAADVFAHTEDGVAWDLGDERLVAVVHDYSAVDSIPFELAAALGRRHHIALVDKHHVTALAKGSRPGLGLGLVDRRAHRASTVVGYRTPALHAQKSI